MRSISASIRGSSQDARLKINFGGASCEPFPIYTVGNYMIKPHMVIGGGVKVPPRPIFWTPYLNRMELTGTLPWLFLNMLWLQNDLYLATLPPPGKSKWRPQSRDFVCFSILTTHKLHISAPIADSNSTIVTATPIFGVQQLNDTVVHCIWHKGVQKFKMAAYKPEVLISQLVDEIEKPFQGLPPFSG